MAEEAEDNNQPPQKCPECKPGLPGWMATFSDLVTLLLTFFVLLLSFAKTESAKYEAALGSIRNAFGGNVLKQGEVIQPGKSPDDNPTMFDSQEPIRPFPIEFLTTEGLLDKREINRESTETLNQMREALREFSLSDNGDIYELPEGIQVRVKDKIYFSKGLITPDKISVKVYDRMIQLLSERDWTVFVEGHASKGETSQDGQEDAYELSASRATAVSRSLIRRGVKPEQITTVSYGDSRPVEGKSQKFEDEQKESRRVEFIIRKTDLGISGNKVPSR
jgi:chemotaxis protein MotB